MAWQSSASAGEFTLWLEFDFEQQPEHRQVLAWYRD